ncbi:exopolysaccharide biosynthesis protein [Mesobacterium pallidum]|uniref:exopolysaccharide biosynthesis protein n=1 Tax=Mesobacterium pallidum TaxID=2872037 RepID=UPI001EE1B0AE|nr:exopolysaccharide biosynthesis protein [Mesobacterium pallidum]
MTAAADPTSLKDLLERVRSASEGERTGLREIIQHVGERSFAPALLVPALLLVSPLSGIPGTPTIGAAIILMISLQWLAGRDHLWLPDVLMRREIASKHMQKALDWLDRPARFVDRHSGKRLRALVHGPSRYLSILVICLIVITWPFLELLPMVTSTGAFAVSLLTIGLMLRDGVYVVAGYAFIGVLGGVIYMVAGM